MQDGWIPPPDFKHPPVSVRPGCQPCRFDWTNMTTGLCLFDVENDPTEVSRDRSQHMGLVDGMNIASDGRLIQAMVITQQGKQAA